MNSWHDRVRFPRVFRSDASEKKEKNAVSPSNLNLGRKVSYLSNPERERLITLEKSRRFYGNSIAKKTYTL